MKADKLYNIAHNIYKEFETLANNYGDKPLTRMDIVRIMSIIMKDEFSPKK